jgi:hypothetical protein
MAVLGVTERGGRGGQGSSKCTGLYDHFSHQAAGGEANTSVVAAAHIVDSKAFSLATTHWNGNSWALCQCTQGA